MGMRRGIRDPDNSWVHVQHVNYLLVVEYYWVATWYLQVFLDEVSSPSPIDTDNDQWYFDIITRHCSVPAATNLGSYHSSPIQHHEPYIVQYDQLIFFLPPPKHQTVPSWQFSWPTSRWVEGALWYRFPHGLHRLFPR